MEAVYGLKDLEVWRDQAKGRVGENHFPPRVNSWVNCLPRAEYGDDKDDLYQSAI